MTLSGVLRLLFHEEIKLPMRVLFCLIRENKKILEWCRTSALIKGVYIRRGCYILGVANAWASILPLDKLLSSACLSLGSAFVAKMAIVATDRLSTSS